MRKLSLLIAAFLFCVFVLSGCASAPDKVHSSVRSVVYVTPIPTSVVTAESSSSSQQYVLNTNTHKFHKPSCSSVKQMKEKNKLIVNWSREEIIDNGYDPCGRCHP